jgi:aryl-alcohol dehydrogenase-like predicted oxidoreductase
MNYRQLGATGISVSEIGLGCGGIGEGALSGEYCAPILEAAFDNGLTFYDTAEGYGCGESERVLGRVFSGRRDQVVIASKFGGVQAAPGKWSKDFSPARLDKALENSLRRLKSDYIDLYQLHTPGEAELFAPELLRQLDAALDAGKIRCYGLSNDDGQQACRFLDVSRAASVQLTCNLFSQKDRQFFLEDQALARQVGVICKVPLSGGLLGGSFSADYPASDEERRQRWGEESFGRRLVLAEKVRPILTSDGRSMAQGALAWLLSFEAVSTVIPGISSLERTLENIAASNLRLSSAELQELDAMSEVYGLHLGW